MKKWTPTWINKRKTLVYIKKKDFHFTGETWVRYCACSPVAGHPAPTARLHCGQLSDTVLMEARGNRLPLSMNSPGVWGLQFLQTHTVAHTQPSQSHKNSKWFLLAYGEVSPLFPILPKARLFTSFISPWRSLCSLDFGYFQKSYGIKHMVLKLI